MGRSGCGVVEFMIVAICRVSKGRIRGDEGRGGEGCRVCSAGSDSGDNEQVRLKLVSKVGQWQSAALAVGVAVIAGVMVVKVPAAATLAAVVVMGEWADDALLAE
eukprot:3346000-Pleurochrysis_carterae.AAC.4